MPYLSELIAKLIFKILSSTDSSVPVLLGVSFISKEVSMPFLFLVEKFTNLFKNISCVGLQSSKSSKT